LGNTGGTEGGIWLRVEGRNFEFMQMRWVIVKVMKAVIFHQYSGSQLVGSEKGR
jgi:hypothetical protein